MSSAPVTVLLTGLTAAYVARHDSNWDPEKLQKLLDESLVRLNEAPDLKADVCWIDADHDSIEEKFQSTFRDGTGKHGRAYDGALIGWGLRCDASLTVIFQDMVNAVRKTSPSTTLIFNGGQHDHLEAIQRTFPQLK